MRARTPHTLQVWLAITLLHTRRGGESAPYNREQTLPLHKSGAFPRLWKPSLHRKKERGGGEPKASYQEQELVLQQSPTLPLLLRTLGAGIFLPLPPAQLALAQTVVSRLYYYFIETEKSSKTCILGGGWGVEGRGGGGKKGNICCSSFSLHR